MCDVHHSVRLDQLHHALLTESSVTHFHRVEPNTGRRHPSLHHSTAQPPSSHAPQRSPPGQNAQEPLLAKCLRHKIKKKPRTALRRLRDRAPPSPKPTRRRKETSERTSTHFRKAEAESAAFPDRRAGGVPVRVRTAGLCASLVRTAGSEPGGVGIQRRLHQPTACAFPDT